MVLSKVVRTVSGVLLHNFHSSHNARGFAVGVVEECKVSFLHLAHEISRYHIISSLHAERSHTLPAELLPTGLRTPIPVLVSFLEQWIIWEDQSYRPKALVRWHQPDHQLKI